jgi:hypothetical protein
LLVRGRRQFLGALLVVGVTAFGAPASAAGGEPADDAFSLVHEQTVTGASKRALPLSETPSLTCSPTLIQL